MRAGPWGQFQAQLPLGDGGAALGGTGRPTAWGKRSPAQPSALCGEAGPKPLSWIEARGRWAAEPGGATHHGAELHHQQVGRHLGALGQALEQVAML